MVKQGHTVQFTDPDNDVSSGEYVVTGVVGYDPEDSIYCLMDAAGNEVEAYLEELNLISHLSPVDNEALLEVFATYITDRERDLKEGAEGYTMEGIANELAHLYTLISRGGV